MWCDVMWCDDMSISDLYHFPLRCCDLCCSYPVVIHLYQIKPLWISKRQNYQAIHYKTEYYSLFLSLFLCICCPVSVSLSHHLHLLLSSLKVTFLNCQGSSHFQLYFRGIFFIPFRDGPHGWIKSETDEIRSCSSFTYVRYTYLRSQWIASGEIFYTVPRQMDNWYVRIFIHA